MLKMTFAAMLLSSAVAFTPGAASAHYTGYHHRHHGSNMPHCRYIGERRYCPRAYHYGY